MTSYRDWVVETSSTTGTGAYALSGSPPAGTSYFTFRQRYSNGEDKIVYWVVNANRTAWEKNRFGTLTYGSPDTLSRNVVESTNGDAPVSWTGGDAPLRIYVVPDADAEEFAISMGLGPARPDVLKYGQWADEGGLATNFDQIKHYDGDSDDVIGVINRTAHEATMYGLPPCHLTGMTLSRSSASVLGIAAGIAMDSTNVVGIKLASAFTKSTAGAWAAGSGQNGMGNALTIANNTWYHVFAIIRSGVADVYFDTSVSAANKPTNTTHFRRIGSFRTNGSAQIIAFTQTGDLFQWATQVADGSSITTTGLKTVTVPTGVAVEWQGRVNLSAGASAVGLEILTPGVTADASSLVIITGTSEGAAVPLSVLTNTSAQINDAQHFNSPSYSLFTTGWVDRRGRDG